MASEGSKRGSIVYASGLEESTISSHFSEESTGTLLEFVLDSVWTVVDEITVVFKNEPKLDVVESLSPFGARVLTETNYDSPLFALVEAFKASKAEHCLLTTEKFPFLKPNVVLSLFEAANGQDLAIPKWNNGRMDPFPAVYRRNAFVRISESSSKKTNKSSELYDNLSQLVERFFDIKQVSVEGQLREIDPELDSFFRVQDEKSLQKARTKASVVRVTKRST